eukprot:gnl/TRDRNA2_/TRDRNA2_81278_c0_seq1.p1 gnl/TRDRNA2_/TRDRNA2_81278_c0~~gnl/TRDRNA2_/TRDRNA2_81278_c0_seq1.p1  ORF type:complete len:669 (+),score=101.46 gnl/TRDRNA2_/TRDRNA2_81278_c0_seq1:85-2091(+)
MTIRLPSTSTTRQHQQHLSVKPKPKAVQEKVERTSNSSTRSSQRSSQTVAFEDTHRFARKPTGQAPRESLSTGRAPPASLTTNMGAGVSALHPLAKEPATSPGPAVSLDELVRGGLLDRSRAKAYAAEREDGCSTLSIWELCELVKRPDFRACDSSACQGILPTDAVEVCAEESKNEEVAQRPRPLSAGTVGGCYLNSVLPVARAGGSDASSGRCTPQWRRNQTLAVHDRGREKVDAISGTWLISASGGLGSAKNPQVQLHTLRRNLLQADLRVRGTCGPVIEMWVLQRSRWGTRVTSTKHSLEHVQSVVGEEFASLPRRLYCECELPPGKVLTIVIACSAAKGMIDPDLHDSQGESVIFSHDESSMRSREGENDSSATSDLQGDEQTRKLLARTSKMHAVTAGSGPEARIWYGVDGGYPGEAPTFDLRLTLTSPLARGPELLAQRPLATDPLATASKSQAAVPTDEQDAGTDGAPAEDPGSEDVAADQTKCADIARAFTQAADDHPSSEQERAKPAKKKSYIGEVRQAASSATAFPEESSEEFDELSPKSGIKSCLEEVSAGICRSARVQWTAEVRRMFKKDSRSAIPHPSTKRAGSNTAAQPGSSVHDLPAGSDSAAEAKSARLTSRPGHRKDNRGSIVDERSADMQGERRQPVTVERKGRKPSSS